MAKTILKGIAESLLFLFLGGYICFAGEVQWQEVGRGIFEVKSVLVSPDESNIIYMGTSEGVLKTEDAAKTWSNILSINGQNKGVNFLLFDPKHKLAIYAATSRGLYHSTDAGKNWNRIFMGKNAHENECTTVAVLSSGIYLGTKAGLFVSKDKGRTWQKETGKLGDSAVSAVSYKLSEADYIYVASLNGVFKTSDSGKSWDRIFAAHPVEDGDDSEEKNEDQDEEECYSDIRYLGIDPNNSELLYIATRNGVLRSKDKGKTWEAMTDSGLLNRDIRFLLISSKSDIYAVTKSGVFEYKNERWHELSLGLIAEDIRFLAQDSSSNLYAACDSGLFRSTSINPANFEQNSIESFYVEGEPKINEVQEAAIKYAEVEPEKIKQWRKQAAKKALLPQFSCGIDRNTTDLWHWEGGSTTKEDDDVLRRGHDSIDWNVSLTWDLSELIWNNDQTSIDVRSRLLVQLRDDILDEVTKLYFERIRVKMEIDGLSIEDRKKRAEKELKLNELTAYLDGLTGGYFSKNKTGS
jgi:photosystem II stability/assembly factor-like uncharacterized protein